MKHWILVSFATGGEFYHRKAKELKSACGLYGIPHDIQIIEDKGGYRRNCRYKPAFVLEMLHKHKKAVFWSDVDNQLNSTFDLPEYESLAACPKRNGSHLGFYASCLYFPYNEQTIQLVEKWKQATMGSDDDEENVGDHRGLCKLTKNKFLSLGYDFHSLRGGTGKIMRTVLSGNNPEDSGRTY